MKFTRSSLALAGALLFFTVPSRAELSLPAIFGDNMVLQQQMPVPVWGWAAPGTTVTVTFAGQTKSARAAADGKWLVKLGKLAASFKPASLAVTGDGTKSFTNILVGEVWLGSGQSNMEKPIGKQAGQKPTFNAEAELAAADFPSIRIFKIDKTLAATEQSQLPKNSGWLACSSNSLDGISFSAAAYFFGREIHTNLHVPVGLVESSWGGTRIEPWTAPVGFKTVASLGKLAVPIAGTGKLGNTNPLAIYNAMIAPITGFAMRGALWYQGESNCMGTNDDDYLTYTEKMEALVIGWRKVWGEGSFPFYFVQIAPFKYYGGKVVRVKSPETLAEFWALQERAAQGIKNTGMAATTDLTDNLDDIHPRNKSEVGHRLALLALDKTYGVKVVSSGPVFKSVTFTGSKAVVKFDHADGGLVSKGGGPLTWFTVAGAGGKFVPATATIADGTVEVSAADIAEPKAVRFAWAETAQPNLFNGAGLPAIPFETGK
ncbi:MAG TPA: sialate O-acetylesterase [Verrucomicrobiae bacterium]|nr:sialate O-acetylesterase [Verrucomicrobiae bacterium]